MASGSIASRVRRPHSIKAQDPWGNKRQFDNLAQQMQYAKAAEFTEEGVKKELQDYQKDGHVAGLNIDGLAMSAAKLAYTISEMRLACEKKVESNKDEKERKRLNDELFKQTRKMMRVWMNDQAWGQAPGLKVLKETCAFTVTTSIMNAESVPLDPERAQRDEKEEQEWVKRWNEEQRAAQEEREKGRGNAAGPSGTQQGEEMGKGRGDVAGPSRTHQSEEMEWGEGGGQASSERTGLAEVAKKRKRGPED